MATPTNSIPPRRSFMNEVSAGWVARGCKPEWWLAPNTVVIEDEPRLIPVEESADASHAAP